MSQRVSQKIGWLIVAGAIALTGCNAEQPNPIPTESPVVQSPDPTSTGLVPNPSPTETPPSVSPDPSLTPTPSPTVEKPDSVKAVETNLAGLVGKAGNLTIQSVDCPATLSAPSQPKTVATALKTFDCQVNSDAGVFTVTVEPTSDPSKFRWGTKGMLLLSKLNEFIQKSAESKDLGKVAVDCGGKIRPAKVGETFDCKVTDTKGVLRTLKVTVRDEVGNVFIAPLSRS